MADHEVFGRFPAVECVTTGIHVFDIVGSATRVAYKRAWKTHALPAGKKVKSPVPHKDEHYLDWIAVLRSVARASGTYRIAELGAGWAPWAVRGALAAKQMPHIKQVEMLAVEAEPTHFQWMLQHISDNGFDPLKHHLIHGAAAGVSGMVSFPDIDNPDEDYGAGLARAAAWEKTVSVPAYTIPELLDRMSGPVDFLHVDIQGAEYDTLPPALSYLSKNVRSIMVGTHQSDAKHDNLVDMFLGEGWTEIMNYGRNRSNQTPWGQISTNDGFVLFDNPALL